MAYILLLNATDAGHLWENSGWAMKWLDSLASAMPYDAKTGTIALSCQDDRLCQWLVTPVRRALPLAQGVKPTAYPSDFRLPPSRSGYKHIVRASARLGSLAPDAALLMLLASAEWCKYLPIHLANPSGGPSERPVLRVGQGVLADLRTRLFRVIP
jgi:hypothetical protein